MSKTYTFECFDDEDQSRTLVEFTTENDAWSGYDGPVWRFLDFLRGCGYVFGDNSTIGIMDSKDEFISASLD